VTILQICVLLVAAALLGRLGKGRSLALLSASALALFWLQPQQQVPSLRFWIPVATLAIVVLIWAVTAPPEVRGWRRNWPAVTALATAILAVDLVQYVPAVGGPTAHAPRFSWPQPPSQVSERSR